MKSLPRHSHCSNVKDGCRIAPSRCVSIWMTSTSMCSKKNSSMCIQCETTRGEVSCGLAMSKGPPQHLLRLPSQAHCLGSRTHPLSNTNRLSEPLVYPKLNVDNSR